MLKQNQDNNATSSLNAKKDTMGTIASIQTLLERYPVLVTVDPKTGTTSFSFMLNILEMLGVTQEDIIKWMCNLLSDKKDGNSGLLVAIEQAVKVVILASLKDAYTCSVNPILPDSIMHTPYDMESASQPCRNEGVTVNLNDIDVFGLLNNCPTDKRGSIFYFDSNSDNGYTPLNVYSSTDFNAYLWYIINKGAFSTGSSDERKRMCVWDNRVFYRMAWEKSGCLVGEPEEGSSKRKFIDTPCTNSPTLMVKGVGPKQEFVICEYKEVGVNSKDANCLTIYANSYRYYKTGILGKNKTIFEFNADYIAGLKLFDSKTIIAQVTNSLLGISTSLQVNASIQMQLITEKVKSIVEKIIESEDNDTIEDCYFSFSNDEYNRLLEKSIEKYYGVYPNGDANGGKSKINTETVLEDIYKIGESKDLIEETIAIQNVFTSIAGVVSEDRGNASINAWAKQELGLDIIEKFLKEIMTQIVMQVLSPKVMLLYAINSKVLNPIAPSIEGIQSFFDNFGNLIVAIIKQIKNIIIQELFDFLMGQLKPLITLFIQKLLLETLTYYRILITELIKACMFSMGGNEALQIDNVDRADIIPIMEEPQTDKKC